MDNGNIIHLIVLTESSHDAEVLASTFRNSGYAVRSKHVENSAGLSAALAEKGWDLLIASPKVGDLTAVQALDAIKSAGKDIPCIILGNELSKEDNLAFLQAGASYCVQSGEEELFEVVVQRELGHLKERRQHRLSRTLLAESEKRNRALIDSSRDPIAYIHEGMHIYANLSYLELFGYDTMEEIEVVPIMDMISGGDQQKFKELLRTLSKGETPKEKFEFNAQTSTGEEFKASMSFSPASIEGEPCTQIVIHQQSENKELEKELEQLRKQDLVTGLSNSQFFMEQLTSAVTAAAKGEINSVLMYLEPDNFKAVRDTVGIAGSDVVINDIANILRENTHKNTVIARFSDTVFTAIFPKQAVENIEKIADKIRAVFEQHIFEVENNTVTTTCSIGITPITETSPDSKILMSQAESACAIARNEGGNRVHIHTLADQLASLEEERAWIERVKLALKSNGFTLFYQPIVSLHAEPGERYEVLLRMNDGQGNIYEPAEFMEAAQNAQLMGEVDKWVMKNTAKAALEKRRDGKQIQFFVKLSEESVQDVTLLPWISKLLKAARLHGNSFVFQISEAVVLKYLKNVKALSQGLKKLHCLFALDNAGNDPSMLKHIQLLGLNYVKIDGSHIATLTTSESSQEIVKSFAEAASEKQILTIAQHVQDPACLAVLWQHGINFIQGHYLQKPEESMSYDFTSSE